MTARCSACSSSASPKSHQFYIEGWRDAEGSTKTRSLRGFGGLGSQHGRSFRAGSHRVMNEWRNDIGTLCARYLVASEQRSGPVHTAVRSAGFVSEEEEEQEGMSNEGSSGEE